jgi:hypothetical protein
VTETPLERPLCIDPKSLIKDNQTTYRNWHKETITWAAL